MPVIPPSMNLFGSKNPFKPKLAETIPMMISMTLLLSALIVTHFFFIILCFFIYRIGLLIFHNNYKCFTASRFDKFES